MKRAFQGIGGVLTVALVLTALFFGGWAIREYNVNRSADIRRDQFEVQETARDEVLRQAAQIEAIEVQLANPTLSDNQKAALEGQRKAMEIQLCNVAASITDDTASLINDAINRYCR